MSDIIKKNKSLLFSIISAGIILSFWSFSIKAKINQNLVSDKNNTIDQNISQNTASDTQVNSKYKNGTYYSSREIFWGKVDIKVKISNDKLVSINFTQLPPTSPSHYSANLLIKQALNAQSGNFNGVSGATYTSDAFRDELNEILTQSKS